MKHLIGLLIFIAISAQAHAAVLLEPYIGYHRGEWEQGSADEKMDGITFGGRFAYKPSAFFVGVDYMTGKWEDSSDPSYDVTPTDLGFLLGYDFTGLVRGYFVYGWDAELEFERTGSADFEGTTMKFGLGFKLSSASLNFEYIMGKYDEVDGVDMSTDRETTMMGLTLSLPLEI